MIVFGLGNPGSKLRYTKHNFGFWVIDKIVEKCSLNWKSGYGDYVYAKNNDIIFVKPTTYMNHSGIAVKDVLRHYDQTEFIVVYDDIDLFLGTMRFRDTGGAGGHKGIESIIYQLQTDNFDRLKIGIGLHDVTMRPSEMYVLQPFPTSYSDDVKSIVLKATEALDFYLVNNITETMNKYNGMIEGEINNDNK